MVLSFPAGEAEHVASSGREYRLLVLSGGVKCLPFVQLSPHGDKVHDMHAEILARRGLRRWLLQRLLFEQAPSDPTKSDDGDSLPEPVFLLADGAQEQVRGWRLNPFYKLHLYISRAPCGDASASQILDDGEEQSEQAIQPAAPQASITGTGIDTHLLRGRSESSRRGLVRTKPGRADSPASISMSCSDKLALWQACGMQGALLSRLIVEPVRLDSIVIGCDGLSTGGPTPDERAATLVRETQRAVHDRVARFLPSAERDGIPRVQLARLAFEHAQNTLQAHSRDQALAHGTAEQPVLPCTTAFCAHTAASEPSRASSGFFDLLRDAAARKDGDGDRILKRDKAWWRIAWLDKLGAHGIRQGAALKLPNPTPAFTQRHRDALLGLTGELRAEEACVPPPVKSKLRSALCKAAWWEEVEQAARLLLPHTVVAADSERRTYRQANDDIECEGIRRYQQRKTAVRGNMQAEASARRLEAFLLSQPLAATSGVDATSAREVEPAPLQGWLASPTSVYSFLAP